MQGGQAFHYSTNLTQRSWVVEGEAWTDHPGVPAGLPLLFQAVASYLW